MKNIKLLAIAILACLTITSCEEVIDLKLDTAAPKLVVDASIKWQKGTEGSIQKIKLTTTTDFYSGSIPVATGAVVTVTNVSMSTPTTYQFNENQQTGEYICSNFIPIVNNNYTLTIVYQGQTYSSTSLFMATPSIANTEQIVKPGFTGTDIYQVKFFFQDNGTETNFYLVGLKSKKVVYPQYRVIDDGFTQGKLMFAVYQDELEKGDVVDYTIQGITEKYNNYMRKLTTIAGAGGGSPFATPPATVRGNIVNTTNTANFPLGFFNLSEIDAGRSIIK